MTYKNLKTQQKNSLGLANLKILGLVCLLTGLGFNVHAETIAIEGATIHTQSDEGVLKNATLIIEDGEVTGIGKALRIPRDATVIKGNNKVITPGIIDAYSYLGLEEVSLESSTVDKRTSNKNYGASFDISGLINPNSVLLPVNRIEGITHAITKPNNGHSAFAGLGAAIRLGGNDADILVKSDVAVFASIYASEDTSGGSKAATLLSIREAFKDAEYYADNEDAYAEGAARELSISVADAEVLNRVLDNEMPLVVMVSRASDIKSVVALSDDLGIDLVIAGGDEAWIVKDLLAENNVAVMVDTLSNLPGSFDSIGARLDNAALLHTAGVKVIIANGDSHNSRNLKQLAGNAVANGLPWDAAVRIGDKANLVIWDGDPLEVTTYADQVFIDGATIPMVSRSTLLRDRYMDKSDRPKAYVKPQ